MKKETMHMKERMKYGRKTRRYKQLHALITSSSMTCNLYQDRGWMVKEMILHKMYKS